MPGVEIHAQLIENLFDQTLLARPAWAPRVEALAFLLLGSVLVVATPRWKPHSAALLALGAIALLLACRRPRLSHAAPALRRGDPRDGSRAALRDAARADARRGEPAEEVARAHRAAATRGERPHRRRARCGEADPDRDAAAPRLPARGSADRPRGDDDSRARGRRRPVRLLPARRPPAVPPGRRRRRQGSAGQHLHGRQQGAVQERHAEGARRGHRRGHVRGQRGGLPRQPGDAVRHRVRRHPRSRDRRSRLLQCRAREPVPAASGRGDGAPHRGRRGAAAVRGRRLRLSGGALPDAPGRASLRRHRRRDRGAASRPATCTAGNACGGRCSGFAQSTLDARALVDALRADVEAFAAGAEPADDLTVLVLRWNGPRAAGSAASG